MSKKHLSLWVIFALFLLQVLKTIPDNNFHLIFCDVGQGDALLLERNYTQVLIDAGPNDQVEECLLKNMPFWDKQLEGIILTHPDFDHVNGLNHLIDSYKIDQIISNTTVAHTQAFTQILAEIQRKSIPYSPAYNGDTISFEGAVLTILWPEKESELSFPKKSHDLIDKSGKNTNSNTKQNHDANANSIVIKLKFGDFSGLLTGDLEIPQENELISSGKLEKTTVLKIGHHGSRSSTSQELLENIQPTIAVISVGASNTYGHPALRVLQLLSLMEITTYRTDQEGDIHLKTDGKTFWKKQRYFGDLFCIAAVCRTPL